MKKQIKATALIVLSCLTLKASEERVYEAAYEAEVLYLQPQSAYAGFTLTVNGPNQIKYRLHFEGGETPQLSLEDAAGRPLPDGHYTFELKGSPILSEAERAQLRQARAEGLVPEQLPEGHTQSGSFQVADGALVLPASKGDELGSEVVQVGDWSLMANTDGAPNYFGIGDSTTSMIPFRVEVGAPTDALNVSATGELGIGTATPQKGLHLIGGNAPTIRLEQDGSEGFGAQTWDLTSNEANFYIGDATNGNKLPFRIEVNSPTNSLYIATDGVGINTYEPSAQLDVVGDVKVSGAGAQLSITDTTAAPGERALMSLENHGRTWFDFSNTYRDNHWRIGADHFGFRIRDYSPNGQGVFMEFANTGTVSVWSNRGRLLRITQSGDLVLAGDILTDGGNKALSAENEAMKKQIKALEERMQAMEASFK